jgi:16S rRNA (cytosine967-C5)-methyltransferase
LLPDLQGEMIASARRVSYELLCSIEMRSVFSDFALHSPKMAELDSRDRNLVTEIVYGTLRWQGFLDHVLGQVSARPWQKIEPGVKVLLRMSLYQIIHLERVPHHALVDDAVELSKTDFHKGVAGFVNGILRHLIRERPWSHKRFDQECPPWTRVSLPQWLWDRWVARYGVEVTTDYALSLNQPPRRTYRLSGGDPPEWAQISSLVPGAVFVKEGRDAPAAESLPIQDEASQLIPHLFGKVSGWRIWDMCAAPGGKSAILSVLTGPQGFVISSDLYLHRAKRLQQALPSRGHRHGGTVVLDGVACPPFLKTFDAVLVDAPCSGLGTLRRNPEIKWRLQSEDLTRLAELQTKLLASAATAVAPGGYLLYSTCSTETEENEDVIHAFLGRHPRFRLKPPECPQGIDAWRKSDMMIRTFPSTRRWDGFFAALMELQDTT